MSQGPLIKIENITPSMAAQMLGTSKGNRTIRKNAVNRYARDMMADAWSLNGEAIKFDVAGRLVDGHHRLSAVIAAQKPIMMLVVRNVPADAMLTLDTGVGRSFYDASTVAGKGYDQGVGPIARWWYRYELGKPIMAPTASHQELDALVTAHASIAESAVYIHRLKTVRKYCVPGVQGFVHAYTSEKYDRELADVFQRDLNDGAKLDEHSPIFVLRRILIENDRKQEGYRVLAYTIKAWNAWMAGDKLKILVWRNSGATAEGFPKFGVDEQPTPGMRYGRRKIKERLEATVPAPRNGKVTT